MRTKKKLFPDPWRHQRKVILLFLGAGILLLAACSGASLPATPTATRAGASVETLVGAKLTEISRQQSARASDTPIPPAEPTATATRPPTSTPNLGFMPVVKNVNGKVCFPSEIVPEMTAYFENTQSHEVVELPIQQNQTSYQVELPPGKYLAYAWLPDFSLGGLYSKAVPCGLKSGCDDHSPLPFEVKLGEQVQNIDLCDWYAGPFNVPYPPNKEQGQVTGGISGALSYPGGNSPALRVVAFNLITNNWYYVATNPGWNSYSITELPPGVYHVVAYEQKGKTGGHADAQHRLSDVFVKAGETTQGADINDWEAPPGAFPPNPTP